MRPTNRRDFVKHCAAASAIAIGWRAASCAADEEPQHDWAASLEDPVRTMFSGPPDLDKVLALFPRTQGPAAFDPKLIDENIAKLQTNPKVDTGHPFLDKSVLTGLAHIDATFRGDHPKYGVGTYAASVHDGFPPTIIAAVDALSVWGMNRRACELFRYWLAHFVERRRANQLLRAVGRRVWPTPAHGRAAGGEGRPGGLVAGGLSGPRSHGRAPPAASRGGEQRRTA